MPLIIMAGMPCVGKTTRTEEIKEYFGVNCNRNVISISENEIFKEKGLNKNQVFSDSQREKEIRGILKSNALRQLKRDNVVILDASNYIKGYRYELYCAAKSMKTTRVTVECIASREQAEDWNSKREESERYSDEVMAALCLRYEAPNSNARWDAPLFTALAGEPLDLESIQASLFNSKPPPPNASTLTTPVSGSDFVYELDRVTQEITTSILDAKKIGIEGPNVNLTVYEGCKIESLPGNLTAPMLARHRRQFLNYTKLHPPSGAEQTPKSLATLFVAFLNSIFTSTTGKFNLEAT